MSRVQIPVTDITRAGVAPGSQISADAANKHYVPGNDAHVFLEIVSTDAADQTVSIEPSPNVSVDGLSIGSLVVSVPAGATRYSGPFRVTTFKQDAAGDIYVDPSVSGTLKFRAYRLPAP